MKLYKEWKMIEWRFIVVLIIMVSSAVVVVLTRNIAIGALNSPQVQEYLKRVKGISRILNEISTNYTYYSFTQWFGKSYIQLVAIFAAILSFPTFSKEFSKKTIYLLAGRMSRREIYLSKMIVGYIVFSVITFSGGIGYLLTSQIVGYHLSFQQAFSWTFMTSVGGLLLYQIGVYISLLFKDQMKALLLDIAIYVGLYVLSMIKSMNFLNVFGYMSRVNVLYGKGVDVISTLIVCAVCAAISVGTYFQFKYKDL